MSTTKLEMVISNVAAARLQALVEKTEATQVSDVIANALRLYEHAIKLHESGATTLDLQAVFAE